MHEYLIYPIGESASCHYASNILSSHGFSTIDHPSPDVTHLLLDIPSSHNSDLLQENLPQLPDSVCVIGGNLPSHPAYQYIDLLQDEVYLYQNAAITAECAIRTAFPYLNHTLHSSTVLIIGWGRIAKHLALLLTRLGANISVFSRSSEHQAEISSFGLGVLTHKSLLRALPQFQIIFNTAPVITISKDIPLNDSVLKIDLASSPGLEGNDVIRARKLPSLLVPETSGNLIAQTVIRKLKEGTL